LTLILKYFDFNIEMLD